MNDTNTLRPEPTAPTATVGELREYLMSARANGAREVKLPISLHLAALRLTQHALRLGKGEVYLSLDHVVPPTQRTLADTLNRTFTTGLTMYTPEDGGPTTVSVCVNLPTGLGGDLRPEPLVRFKLEDIESCVLDLRGTGVRALFLEFRTHPEQAQLHHYHVEFPYFTPLERTFTVTHDSVLGLWRAEMREPGDESPEVAYGLTPEQAASEVQSRSGSRSLLDR
jgi:hypothetical protein